MIPTTYDEEKYLLKLVRQDLKNEKTSEYRMAMLFDIENKLKASIKNANEIKKIFRNY